MRVSVNRAGPLAALVCLGLAGTALAKASGHGDAPPNGPAADYPMVIGEPFTIDGRTYEPADQLSYDAVGYAAIGGETMAGISAAHKTLPLPSYVEVTSLDTGRTVLVRAVERGPMANDQLIALSPAAAAQLGLSQGAAVRVRRVNPPEPERAMLRDGKQVAERMETPEALLRVLKRKLAAREPLAAPGATAMPAASANGIAITPVDPDKALPPVAPTPAEVAPAVPAVPTAPAAPIAPVTVAESAAKPAKGAHFVQVAAFSTEQRAQAAATRLGAKVEKPGKYWLMRMGPFATRAQAAAALEKAKAAGYSDARIQNAD